MKIMTITQHPRSLAVAVCLITMLGGCAQSPTPQTSGNWHENDFLTRDLAAQLSNPEDLIHGHGDATVPAQAFVAAITSWSTGKSASSGAMAGLSFSGVGAGAGTP